MQLCNFTGGEGDRSKGPCTATSPVTAHRLLSLRASCFGPLRDPNPLITLSPSTTTVTPTTAFSPFCPSFPSLLSGADDRNDATKSCNALAFVILHLLGHRPCLPELDTAQHPAHRPGAPSIPAPPTTAHTCQTAAEHEHPVHAVSAEPGQGERDAVS